MKCLKIESCWNSGGQALLELQSCSIKGSRGRIWNNDSSPVLLSSTPRLLGERLVLSMRSFLALPPDVRGTGKGLCPKSAAPRHVNKFSSHVRWINDTIPLWFRCSSTLNCTLIKILLLSFNGIQWCYNVIYVYLLVLVGFDSYIIYLIIVPAMLLCKCAAL